MTAVRDRRPGSITGRAGSHTRPGQGTRSRQPRHRTPGASGRPARAACGARSRGASMGGTGGHGPRGDRLPAGLRRTCPG